MAIKVHGNTLSVSTARVLACLNEKGLDYELIHVDMASNEHKKEPFLSKQPFGQVPAFEDGDFKLFESGAITQYIAQAYPEKGTPDLMFQDPKKMAIVSVWIQVEALKFGPPASKIIWELVIKPAIGMSTDYDVVEEETPKLAEVLDVYEARLAQSKYLGGDTFTLADLHHLSSVDYLLGTRVKAIFDSRPHLSAWCADIVSRPAWQKVVAMRNNH